MGTFDNIANSLSNVAGIAQQYIVAPIAAFGLGGYVFSAQGDAVANLSADITDHYTEDNKAIQDHIAIKPKRITLKGYVGELVYNQASNPNTVTNTLAQKLTVVAAYLPVLASGAQQLQTVFDSNTSTTTSSILTSTSNIYSIIQNVLGATGNTKNQQNAYTYFKSLMQSGTLMGVQTPWEFMTNMAIENIVAYQDEKTQYISDFAVTYKELRFASTALFSPISSGGNIQNAAPTFSGDSAAQNSPVTQLGNTPGAAPPFAVPGVQGGIFDAANFTSIPTLQNVFSY